MSTERRRWAALIVLCTGMLMIVLDLTVVNVALSAIQHDLHFTDAGLAWVVNAYMIAFGGLLLLAGRLGDLLGRRRVFLAGLAVFMAASLACGLAQSQAVLVVARFVQGVGGAMTSAVVLGMIVTLFPEPREQARAIGAFAFVASAGGAVGLLVGGALTQSINWHWIFFVNIPIGAVTAAFALRLVDDERGIGLRSGADVVGAATVTAALMLGVYTIVGPASADGWTDPQTAWLGLARARAARAVRAARALGRPPARPARHLPLAQRDRRERGPGARGGRPVRDLLPRLALPEEGSRLRRPADRLRLPADDGADGGIVGPLHRTAGDAVRRPPGDDRRAGPHRSGARRVHLGAGRRSYSVHVLPVMVLLGVGAGLAFPALMTLAMSGVTGENAGLASGLVNTTAQVGAALGLAVLATLSAGRSRTLAGHGAGARAALTGGYHLAFWVAAALIVVAIVVALVVLQAETPAAVPNPSGAAGRDAETEDEPDPVAEPV